MSSTEAVDAVADDRAADDYGLAEHQAAIEGAYVGALAAIAALAGSWQPTTANVDGGAPDGDYHGHGEGAARDEGPETGEMSAVTDRPGVPAPRAA